MHTKKRPADASLTQLPNFFKPGTDVESTDELTELADVSEGLCMPRPYQGLAAFGLEEVDLLRVDGDAPPLL